MTWNLLLLCVASFVLVAVLGARPVHAKGSASAGPTLRRYALVIGSNTGGGTGRERLRYAGNDASKVADVLRQLGGVSQPDLSLLREPDTGALDRAFDGLSKRVREERKQGQRVELVVYYSGHADESGILIGGTRYVASAFARSRQMCTSRSSTAVHPAASRASRVA